MLSLPLFIRNSIWSRTSSKLATLPYLFGNRTYSKAVQLTKEMETVHTTERLKSLRQLMKEHKIDIYGTG